MPKYRVKQRWLSGRGKKIWKSFDEVTEKDFPENFDKLLKSGAIVEIDESNEDSKPSPEPKKETKPEIKPSPADKPANGEVIESDFNNPMGEPLFVFEGRNIYSIEDISKKEVLKELGKTELDFKSSSSKAVLFDMLLENL